MVHYLSWLWLLTNLFTFVSSKFSGSLFGPKYFINKVPTSQPLLFHKEFDSEVHVINNATLIVKKKKPTENDNDQGYSEHSIEPQRYGMLPDPEETFHNKRKKRPSLTPYFGNYHFSSTNNQPPNTVAVTWSPTQSYESIRIISNHKPWNGKFGEKASIGRRKASTPKIWTSKSYTTSTALPLTIPPDIHRRFLINNHMTSKTRIRHKPRKTPKPFVDSSFNTVKIINKVQKDRIVDILGDRLKQPDIITSPEITVLDSPSNVKTIIKHKNLVVIQKRIETNSDTSTRSDNLVDVLVTDRYVVTSKPLITLPEKTKSKPGGQSISSSSASSNPWASIPIPSRPSSSSSTPPKGSASTTSQGVPSMFPIMPIMPFLTSIISPLLKKPLTPETVNTGMQGIKAMQGFLRKSLIGAMICFLPSALIAVSLNAVQRAELRKSPNMDDMVVFCKTCLQNLKTLKTFAREQPSWWEKVAGHHVMQETL